MTTAQLTVAELRAIDLFDGLDDAELEPWLAAAEPFDAAPGDVLAAQGQTSDGPLLLLEGTAEALSHDEGRVESLGRHEAPTWMGAIAALTELPVGVEMRARTTCRAARIPRERFVELTLASPPVHARIMRVITPVMNRLNSVEHTRERLASLGTMAAGLAHELNNPAAAAKRAAADLVEALEVVSGTIGAFVESGIERADAEHLVRLQHQALDRAAAIGDDVDAVEAADAEDEMLDRLEDLGIPEAWRIAEPLARAGLDADWLEEVNRFGGRATAQALHWVAASLTARGLAGELAEATERVSTLVGAVKTYAYMDRGGVVVADIHEGIVSTLIMLKHKLKHKSITLSKDFDKTLPPITMRGSELNQVWTNLLDNAIDALGDGGTITITTRRDDDCVQVDIADDGPGIAPEAQARVLDPFFTTKAVGAGTGLGLDTARRIVEDGHGGSLWFDSSPAGTTFHVRLPLRRPTD
jgi:signal transduction histidine kinase